MNSTDRTQLAKSIRASQVASLTKGVLHGADIEIKSVRPLSALGPNCLAFAGAANATIDPSARGVILVRPERSRSREKVSPAGPCRCEDISSISA